MRAKTLMLRGLGACALATLTVDASAQPGASRVPTPPGYEGGYLVFKSADSAFMYWLDGRMQVDAAFYRGGKNALGSGTEIRRGRLGWKATLFRDWYAEIDVDFSENAVDMKDMWVGYLGFDNTLVRVGNFREPFSLETITTSKYITFMERSYVDNFSPDRRIGAAVTRWWDRFHVSGGVFGQEIATVDETAQGEGYAFTGRAVVAPINREGRLLHIGGALSRRTPDAAEGNDTSSVRFRARPETDISKVRFLTTGRVRGVDHTSYYNAEFAGVYGPLTVQSEYTKVVLRKQDTANPDPAFDGYYASVSYFLTGETRPYLISEGEFDRVIPRRARGAWEVAARVSSLDLNDTRTGVDITGGQATNYTLGLNWYINANFKWMLNYVRVINDDNAEPDFGRGPAVAGDKFNIFQTRFAVAF